MMKAVRVHEHGDFGVLKLEEVAQIHPGTGEVLVRVAWSALNHLDTWVRRGVPGHKFPLPITTGCDFSGVIAECGDGVSGWDVGRRVCVNPGFSCGSCPQCQAGKENLCREYGIYGESTDGGNAEFAVVKAESLIAVPDEFPLDLAAAFPLTYLTAWHMLVGRCGVRAGDKVLVHAAGSGVSVAATQIAKYFGAMVMVTAGTDEKVKKGLGNGADHGTNYREQDWPNQARTWAGGSKFDIIVDHVGADTLPAGIRLLAKGGQIVICGVTSGAEIGLNFSPIFFKSLSIHGSTMGEMAEMHEVASLVWEHKLRPVIDSRFKLEEVASAHQRVSERAVFGKVLLEVDSSQG
ncbi:MAG: alcohol dehydrogenase [Planctomycetota bacterium]|nr:MAG: alcohol dehydrogenase [Planctomycetota bacterium]